MPSYDVCIVGGGIQGCGVAQAAAAAGYRTVVLEQTDLASATSSRSSKLIHGGLRYLESGQLALVARSIAERERLIRNAPGLVRRVPFYIPIYKQTRRRPWQVALGLSVYALLGLLRPAARYRTVSTHEWSQLDGLRTDGLQAVFQYWDAQTDDGELTRAVMYSAMQLGADLLCPAKFVAARRFADGYKVEYEQDGQHKGLDCRVLVNAAGPWVASVHDSLQSGIDLPALNLVQGAHLILKQSAPSGFYYLESPADRRAVFVMPWQGHTLVGTTETVIHGNPANVKPAGSEIDYLRSIVHHYFPHNDDTVLSQFAGVRVLPDTGKGVFHSPREAMLFTQRDLPAYLVMIGGKLTAYRATAEDVISKLRSYLPACTGTARDTRDLKLEQAPGHFMPGRGAGSA